MRDIKTLISFGWAFIEYDKVQDALEAKNQANYMKLINKVIRVTWKENIKSLN